MNNLELKERIKEIGKEIIEKKGFFSSIDILLRLNYLSKKDYEKWRAGKVEYLEKICCVNLKKLSTINQIIKEISECWSLKKSWTSYNAYGKGENRKLRFSKSGNKMIEEIYATHYIDIQKTKKKIHESTTNCKKE